MKKIPIKAFTDLIHLPKRVALRKLYADFDVRLKADRKRCNKAWELLSNAIDAGNTKMVGDTESSIQSGKADEGQSLGE